MLSHGMLSSPLGSNMPLQTLRRSPDGFFGYIVLLYATRLPTDALLYADALNITDRPTATVYMVETHY